MMLTLILRKAQNTKDARMHEDFDSPVNFSVMLLNLPDDITEDEIKWNLNKQVKLYFTN